MGDTENTAYRIAKKSLKLNLSWKQPSFLRVPKNYEQILEFYHKRKCKGCDRVPKDPTVCLMCGTMVCLKETCCRQINSNNVSVGETVHHALECGGGTGIFLAVQFFYNHSYKRKESLRLGIHIFRQIWVG